MSIYGSAVGLGKRLKWPDNYFNLNANISYNYYDLNNYNAFIIKTGFSNDLNLGINLSRNSIDAPIYPKSGSSFLNDKLTSAKRIKKIGINRANEIRGLGLLQEQNLTLVPFRFALEMQRRGWIIRNVIIWHKPNCMPCSAKNRFTVDFEYLFFFVTSQPV